MSRGPMLKTAIRLRRTQQPAELRKSSLVLNLCDAAMRALIDEKQRRLAHKAEEQD